MKSSNTPTRGRILESAARLFERDGIRGTTVDAIAERAGVTKRTFYYHFRSKDDLIAATLEDARAREFDIDVSGTTPLREIVNEVFDIIEESASDIRWKGGSFSRTIAELAGLPGHPAATLARVHKKRMEAAFQAIIERYSPRAQVVARRLMLLIDGAIAQTMAHHDRSYAREAKQMAIELLEEPESATPRGLPGCPVANKGCSNSPALSASVLGRQEGMRT